MQPADARQSGSAVRDSCSNFIRGGGIALKFGAVPVSLYGLSKDLIGVLIRTQQRNLQQYNDHRENSPAAHWIGNFVGACLSVAGRVFKRCYEIRWRSVMCSAFPMAPLWLDSGLDSRTASFVATGILRPFSSTRRFRGATLTIALFICLSGIMEKWTADAVA